MSLGRFWTQVDAGLGELGIHSAERLVMETTIAARVPRPDPAVLERTRAEFEAWKAGVGGVLRGLATRPRRR